MSPGVLIFNLVGVFMFMYFYWRKLKDDFSSTAIFNSAFTIIFLVIAGFLIAVKFMPQWWFWFSFVGALTGVVLSLSKLSLYKYETIEAGTLGFLVWISMMSLNEYLKTTQFLSLVGLFVVLFLFLVYFVLDKHYKRFSWYKSGRVGFSGLTILGLFFLIRAVFALMNLDMISFIEYELEVVISGAVSLVCFILVYNLSKQET